MRAAVRLTELVLVGLIVGSALTIVAGRVLPVLGHPTFIVAGPSMAPAVPVGALVILEPVPAAALAIGDVVSLQTGPERSVVTHRIVRLVQHDGVRHLETKGDANAAPDPALVPASAVIGRVAAVVPYLGYASALTGSVPGVVFVLATGALLLVIAGLLDEAATARTRAVRGERRGSARPTTRTAGDGRLPDPG